MTDYRRLYVPGGTYFFTVVTHQRAQVFVDEASVDLFRVALRRVMATRPFHLDAIVVLPDHLHCLWRLPLGDADFSGRWREIKKATSRGVERRTNRRNERPVWQRRFWEHLIRDEDDWLRHVEYIHYNPVKHGLVCRPADWPWSSFTRAVAHGWHEADWGASEPQTIVGMEYE